MRFHVQKIYGRRFNNNFVGDNFLDQPINEINFEKIFRCAFILKGFKLEEFGVIEIDSNNKPVNLHEKPQNLYLRLGYIYMKQVVLIILEL